MLLRGADDKQRDKYWGKFQKEEAGIQAAAKSLLSTMPASEARTLVEDFARAHSEMGVAYRRGLKAFVDSGFDSKAGDKAVKGIDRAPTKLLEKAAAGIAVVSQAATESALGQARLKATFAVVTTVGALCLGVVVLVFFLRRFNDAKAKTRKQIKTCLVFQPPVQVQQLDLLRLIRVCSQITE